MAKVKNILPLIIAIIFAFIAGFPLLHKGLIPTHDGEYHVVRFYEFNKVIQQGNLYPRWAPDLNNGYGAPLFNYVYPLPNYIASILHNIFGFSFINSFGLSLFSAVIIGGIFFYLWTRIFWGDLGAMVSSVFYTFSPYHFVDIYIRGSVGEVWALAFFPAFLWAETKLIKKHKNNFIIISGIFLSLIIFSHNILALMFTVFSFLYIGFLLIWEKNKFYLLRNVLYSVFIGLGLSAVFWLPALLEKSYVVGLQIYSIKDNFPEIYQLIFPSWGSGFSSGDLNNQMSFQIGIANLLAVIFGFLVLIFLKNKKNQTPYIVGFFIFWFIIVFFLMLNISLIIWETIPLMNYFQFPWRLLSLEILIASFLAGSIVAIWKSKILALLTICFAVVLSIGYTKPAYYHDRVDSYYLTRSNFMDGTNSIGNAFNIVGFNSNLAKAKEKLKLENTAIKSKNIMPTNYKFIIDAKKNTIAVVNTAYFPGWKAFMDNKEIKIMVNKDGLISFPVPKGQHEFGISLVSTPVQLTSQIISLISISLTFALLINNFYVKIRK